jgi:hypothetical protein
MGADDRPELGRAATHPVKPVGSSGPFFSRTADNDALPPDGGQRCLE